MANGEQHSYYHAWDHIICVQMPVCTCKQMFPNAFCMPKALSSRQKETGPSECFLCNIEKIVIVPNFNTLNEAQCFTFCL